MTILITISIMNAKAQDVDNIHQKLKQYNVSRSKSMNLSQDKYQTQQLRQADKNIKRLRNQLMRLGYIDVLAAVDSTITRIIDVTDNGEPDSVIINIKGDNFLSPFKWTVCFTQLGQTLIQSFSDFVNYICI